MANTVPPTPASVKVQGSSFGDAVSETTGKIERCVKESPRTTMLVSIGAGVGIGVLIGTMIGGSRSRSSSWLDFTTADRIGERVASSLSQWLPDSISDRF